ncbi:hypothetical protein ACFLWN_02740 [Chloroflexota bacterium]
MMDFTGQPVSSTTGGQQKETAPPVVIMKNEKPHCRAKTIYIRSMIFPDAQHALSVTYFLSPVNGFDNIFTDGK